MGIEARRTLVKSVPELWAALSEPAQLAPLLDGAFGEIRITRLEPESLIAWESDLASGRVELEPSGFGTKLRLTAQIAAPEPEPVSEPERPQGRLRRFLRRLRRREPPAPAAPEPPAPTAPALEPDVAARALTALLDEVATPRHRPFSR